MSIAQDIRPPEVSYILACDTLEVPIDLYFYKYKIEDNWIMET